MTKEISFFPKEKVAEVLFEKTEDVFLTNEYNSSNIEDGLKIWLDGISNKFNALDAFLDVLSVFLICLTPVYMMFDFLDIVDKSNNLSFLNYVYFVMGLGTSYFFLNTLNAYYFYNKDKNRLILNNVSFQKSVLNKMDYYYSYFKRHDIDIVDEDSFKTTINQLVSSFSSNNISINSWKEIVLYLHKVKSLNENLKLKEKRKAFIKGLDFDVKK